MTSEMQKAGRPAHELVYRALRDKVLFGDLAPGAAVTIQGLTQALGAGMTPVREALRRLIAEGALDLGDNRRVQVPQLNAGALDELVTARLAIEPELARRAARRAGPEDIAALTAIDDHLDAAIAAADLRGYLEQNYRFHRALYLLAAAPILADLADGLWLRFGPSLRVVLDEAGRAVQPDMHKMLLGALTRGDVDGAAEAIAGDLRQGMARIGRALEEGAG